MLQRGGKVELLGPAALRERISSELMLQLTTREITQLIKKFDTEKRGSVDLGKKFLGALFD